MYKSDLRCFCETPTCESEGRMGALQHGWFQYMNLHCAKNPAVVTFAVLYYASAAEIRVLLVHLVCSIYFTEKKHERFVCE